MELYGLEDAANWRHERLVGALAIGFGGLMRSWAKQDRGLEQELAEIMGAFVPEED